MPVPKGVAQELDTLQANNDAHEVTISSLTHKLEEAERRAELLEVDAQELSDVTKSLTIELEQATGEGKQNGLTISSLAHKLEEAERRLKLLQADATHKDKSIQELSDRTNSLTTEIEQAAGEVRQKDLIIQTLSLTRDCTIQTLSDRNESATLQINVPYIDFFCITCLLHRLLHCLCLQPANCPARRPTQHRACTSCSAELCVTELPAVLCVAIRYVPCRTVCRTPYYVLHCALHCP